MLLSSDFEKLGLVPYIATVRRNIGLLINPLSPFLLLKHNKKSFMSWEFGEEPMFNTLIVKIEKSGEIFLLGEVVLCSSSKYSRIKL